MQAYSLRAVALGIAVLVALSNGGGTPVAAPAAPSPAVGGTAPAFLPDGVHLGDLGFRIAALGRGEVLTSLAPVLPVDDGVRVSYHHDDATEWYLRQGDGVEQGVTLAAPPVGDGPLTLLLATPEAIPLVDTDGAGATLILPHGGQWRYAGLHVTDATGQVLAAHLMQSEGGIRIVVEDAGAVYPVTVDPFVNRQTLAVSGTGQFGKAVALSADGSTALVGANYTNSYAGTAYLYAAPATLTPVHATTPQYSAVSSPFATSLAVTVRDSFGDLAPGALVTFAAPRGGASGVFACPMGGCPTGTSVSGDSLSATVTSDTNGLATAPSFTANTLIGSYAVTTSESDGIGSTNLTPAVFNLTNTAGAAASVTVVSGDHQSAQIGSAFTAPLQVQVRDAHTNLVPGATVTFAAQSGNVPGATFSGGDTATTDASGEASITATAAGRPGIASITASVAGVTTPTTFTLTDTAAPTTLTLTGFSPPSGPTTGGTAVTLTGTNLSGATAVTVGGVNATITANTATSLTLTAPAHAVGTVDITVTAGGQMATLHGYTYLPASGGVAPQPGGHALPGNVVPGPVVQPQRHDDPGLPGGGSGGTAPHAAVPPTATPLPAPQQH